MARTRTQIYNAIIAAKESNSNLDQLLPNPDNWPSLFNEENFKLLANTVLKSLSPSQVSYWRLISNVITDAMYFHETLFDILEEEVDAKILNAQIGQIRWYVNISKLFQYGDELVWNDETLKYEYAVIDEDKRIITQAAGNIAENGIVTIKVAKGVIGSFSPLLTAEKTAFEAYIKGTDQPYAEDGLAPAGVNINIISSDPDDVKMAVKVHYDPLVLDGNGILLSDGVTEPVREAIVNYIQAIPFNAALRRMDLIDAIQAASGVVNVVLDNLDARAGSEPYVDILQEDGQQYIANAGYLAFDTVTGYDQFYDAPFNNIKTIQYIPT